MNETLMLVVAGVTGLVLGAIFFGGLWCDGEPRGTIVGYGDGVFEVGARFAIGGDLRPLIAEHLHPLGSHVNHRLHRDYQAWLDAEVATATQRAT